MTKTSCDKNKLARKFFTERFNRKPSIDREYYKEWVGRIKSGHPETYMDLESLKVWRKIKKKC